MSRVSMNDDGYVSDEEIKRRFSRRLKDLMCERNLTACALGVLSGVTDDSIFNYLNCRTGASMCNVVRLASALGVTVSDLIGY